MPAVRFRYLWEPDFTSSVAFRPILGFAGHGARRRKNNKHSILEGISYIQYVPRHCLGVSDIYDGCRGGKYVESGSIRIDTSILVSESLTA